MSYDVIITCDFCNCINFCRGSSRQEGVARTAAGANREALAAGWVRRRGQQGTYHACWDCRNLPIECAIGEPRPTPTPDTEAQDG